MPGRFTTVTDSYFRANSKVAPTVDFEQLKSHYKFHKGTTYTIGKMGDKSQDSTSLAKESYGHKRMQSEGPLPGRYNQEQSTGLRNMNLANNLSLAADVPAVRGTDSKVQKRSNSTYNQTNKGHYSMPSYYEANALNKINTKFGLSNKFEYGHDPNGGSKSAAVSRIVSKAGNRSISQSVVDNKQKF